MFPSRPSTYKFMRLDSATVVIILLVLSASMVHAQPSQQPLTRDNLVTLLRTGTLSDDELVQIIERRGVQFTLSTENETALVRAGASRAVLYAVSQNYRASERSKDVIDRPSGGPLYPQGSANDYFARGEQYLNANQFKEALAEFQQVIRLAPNNPAGYLGAGLAYGRMGQNSEAATALQQAIRLNPNVPDAYVYLGFAQLGLQRNEQAVTAFKQALSFNPNNVLAQAGIGQAYSELEQYDAAIAAMEQAVRLKPDFAEAYSGLSAIYGNAGRYEDALNASRRAVQLKPDLVEGYINLSYSYGNLGRYQEALDAALQAVRLNSPDPQAAAYAYGNLSYAYIRLSQLPEALNAARQSVSIKADEPNLYSNLGYVQNELGQYGDALASAQQALRLKKKPKEAGVAYYVLGYAYDKLNQQTRALEAFRQSIASYNQVAHPDADDVFYMGNSYMKLGQDQQATEAFERSIRMRPNFSLPRYSLGLLYYAKGNQRGALEQYQILKTLDPRRAAKLLNVINRR